MPWTFCDKIQFNHIAFQYPGTDKLILNDFNMEIKQGEWLGISGSSGIVLLTCPDISEAQMRDVAEKVGILPAIEGGLDRQVGENGMDLSGGERQRVAIARCLLEKRELILLDEATSQLDGNSQQLMAQLLRNEQKARNATVVSVAHRIEFNSLADRTIWMK